MARYLHHHQLCPLNKTSDGELKFIALYTKNREEWVVMDLACALDDITVVTLYDTLGKESIEFIMN